MQCVYACMDGRHFEYGFFIELWPVCWNGFWNVARRSRRRRRGKRRRFIHCWCVIRLWWKYDNVGTERRSHLDLMNKLGRSWMLAAILRNLTGGGGGGGGGGWRRRSNWFVIDELDVDSRWSSFHGDGWRWCRVLMMAVEVIGGAGYAMKDTRLIGCWNSISAAYSSNQCRLKRVHRLRWWPSTLNDGNDEEQWPSIVAV